MANLHVLACVIKVISTSESSKAVDQLRRACGGHGFMCSSNLPNIFGMVTAACTYEGENTVLLLQIARYLVKAVEQARKGVTQPSSCSYLNLAGQGKTEDLLSDTGLTQVFHKMAHGQVSLAVDALEHSCWDSCSILLTQAALAHCRTFVICEFSSAVQNSSLSSEVRCVLSSLFQLLSISWILESGQSPLRHASLTFSDLDSLNKRQVELFSQLRPQAVSLVDSFDFRDEVLDSSLGCWDGWVYHRMFHAALASPLNREGVEGRTSGLNKAKL